MQPDQRRKGSVEVDFFTEYGDWSRYKIEEIIGKGSDGVVCSAYDHLGEKVAIKKINDIFENVSDATRILREIKLLRLLRHPDIVEIKHILLPPSRREFKDIYVVFELMESDLHQVIKANDDLTHEHYRFFLYQLLRGLKYIHTANVCHRDLKPKNILANANCKLKICDFGLAWVAFNDTPTAIFWTDYVATTWYMAPELCGSFFDKYTPAIDTWSIGCIFAELLTGKPLFPGKNVVHQLDLMTDLLGTPTPDAIARISNEKARRYLSSMSKKKPIPFSQKFPNADDPLALRLLERMLAFEPKDRPTAEEALSDPYFKNLAKVEREPSAQPVTRMEFEFERRRITKEDVRELIYREILEYHPNMLKEFLDGAEPTGFMYPSAVDQFEKQFAHLEEHYGKGTLAPPLERQQSSSLPRQSEPSSSIQGLKLFRVFEFPEIQLATENFDESLVIGTGGFGKVYKGNVINGSSHVVAAIKRLDSVSSQGATEFWAEVEILSMLRHCNLVSLIGYCNHGKEMILVYEYMPNGTLEDHLHKLGTTLSWVQRLNICIGAGRGLHYLHTGTGNVVGVVHRDVKSSNILLDETWAAKISDFGLSKIGPTNQPSTYVNTLVKGTFGYLDPDYYATGKLTRKSDVYAFGVVLLEVLCRRRALDRSLDEEQCNLARWAQESIKQGNLKHIIDSNIRDQIYPKCLKEFVRIVEKCLHSHPKKRHTMAEVVVSLESVLNLQEKINSSLQASGRTIFGRMLDRK